MYNGNGKYKREKNTEQAQNQASEYAYQLCGKYVAKLNQVKSAKEKRTT